MKNDWIREDSYEYYDAEPSQYSYTPPVKQRLQRRGRLFHWLFQVVSEGEEVMPQYQTDVPAQPVEEDPLQTARIQEALRAWKDSIAFFESVSDPALIDYAVYDMEAAQKRYMFLLRAATRKDERMGRAYPQNRT